MAANEAMSYVSTRGGQAPASFCDVLLTGLAADGGLIVPAQLPSLEPERLEAWRGLDYADLATEVVSLFATDIPREDLDRLTHAAYGPDRFPAPVVPVQSLDGLAPGLHLLSLSEGPTMAFKDMAMQLLGQLIPYVLRRNGQRLTIVGATSGDTGSAAEHAFLGQDAVRVFMLSPHGRMSDIQRAQMYSIDDPAVVNIAVEGVFDDCQALVKSLNADADFKARHSIGAVNSINIGRIVAQCVYYVWAWLRLTDDVSSSERATYRVDVTVPSGNFGNIYAAHVARSMGVPLRRLVAATNENDVLYDFFTTGVYRPRSSEETVATSSPSMDISRASNLERFVYDLLGDDFAARWQQFEDDGVLDLSDHLTRIREDFGFSSARSTHADRCRTIHDTHAATGVTIDPHTADGVCAALRVGLEAPIPMVVAETAQPTKFPDIITEALGAAPETPAAVTELLTAPQHVTVMANDLGELRRIIEDASQA